MYFNNTGTMSVVCDILLVTKIFSLWFLFVNKGALVAYVIINLPCSH